MATRLLTAAFVGRVMDRGPVPFTGSQTGRLQVVALWQGWLGASLFFSPDPRCRTLPMVIPQSAPADSRPRSCGPDSGSAHDCCASLDTDLSNVELPFSSSFPPFAVLP